MFLSRLKLNCLVKPMVRLLTKGVQLTELGLNDNGKDIMHIETRNMCRCESCYGKHSHQKLLSTICEGVKVTNILSVTENYISLSWSDGHDGMVARTTRGAHGPEPINSLLNKYYDLTMRQNTSQIFWDKENASNTKPFDYSTVISNDENVREFLAHYMTYGIAILSGIPQDRDLQDFVNKDLKVGPIKTTIFDIIDIVRIRANPTNFAYSNSRLPAHTDLPYYTESPSAQFFVCHENTVKGGEGFWIDTYAIMDELRKEKPEYFETLSKVPMYYRHDPPGTDRNLASVMPIIEVFGNNIQRVRDHIGSVDEYEFVRSTEIHTRQRWWEAYLYYRGKVEDKTRRITRRMESGDLVMTDNWRIMHGREDFTTSAEGQERVVATWYVDWNHIQNRLLYVENEAKTFLELDC